MNESVEHDELPVIHGYVALHRVARHVSDLEAKVAELELKVEELDVALGKEQLRAATAIEELQRHTRMQASNIGRLTSAAGLLISRLEEIDSHPSCKSILGIAFAHGVKYTGPSWSEPLNECRAALNNQEPK